jgi:hypothetical protein
MYLFIDVQNKMNFQFNINTWFTIFHQCTCNKWNIKISLSFKLIIGCMQDIIQ